MRYFLFWLCALVVCSCAGTSSGDARAPVVSVGGGSIPTITWMPNGAQAIHVYRGRLPGSDYDLMWSVSAQFTNGIQSPVTYGIMPPGATSDAGPVPLQRGTVYTFIVERAERTGAAGSDSIRIFQGTTTFVP